MAFPIAMSAETLYNDYQLVVAIPRVAFPIAINEVTKQVIVAAELSRNTQSGLSYRDFTISTIYSKQYAQSRNTQSGLSYRDEEQRVLEAVERQSRNTQSGLSYRDEVPNQPTKRTMAVAIPRVAFPIAIMLVGVILVLAIQVAIPRVAFPIAI